MKSTEKALCFYVGEADNSNLFEDLVVVKQSCTVFAIAQDHYINFPMPFSQSLSSLTMYRIQNEASTFIQLGNICFESFKAQVAQL